MLSMWSEAELRRTLLDAATVGAVLCGALFLLDVAITLARRRGRSPGRLAAVLERGSPAILRHLAELTVTAVLALGAARPAHAADTPIRDWLTRAPASATTTAAPPLRAHVPTPPPDAPGTATRPSTTAPSASAPAPAAPPPPAPAPVAAVAPGPSPRTDSTYVVKRGDCLWRIAADRLGPGATNAAIDAGWRSIYALNRAAIGDNPNLIHPGLTLTLPPLLAYR